MNDLLIEWPEFASLFTMWKIFPGLKFTSTAYQTACLQVYHVKCFLNFIIFLFLNKIWLCTGGYGLFHISERSFIWWLSIEYRKSSWKYNYNQYGIKQKPTSHCNWHNCITSLIPFPISYYFGRVFQSSFAEILALWKSKPYSLFMIP